MSSCEAEIVAASEATKDAIYYERYAKELGLSDEKAATLYLDNKGAIDLAYNPEHHQRTKHIERRHFFVRECVENQTLVVPYVASADNLADFFTKPLAPAQFYALRDKIMNVPPQVAASTMNPIE